MQITPEGDVELLSTHDQLLGGPSGQSYRGCSFPADAAYARDITAMAAAVGRELAALGVIGRCAADFITTRTRDGRWRSYAIELNLRKGGTTHPYLLLEQLVGGAYDPSSATYLAADGTPKHYVATDHLDIPIRSLDATALARLTKRDLRFDHTSATGIVLHMLSSAAAGRLGFTAIADTARDAQHLYDHTCATVLAAAANSAALAEAA
jgi:PGM1 C-terminal domain